ncbi:MAG: rhomboid family intramembrane serine protease [Bacteroidota bacterium]
MIPLRDTVRSSTTPYVTYSLIAACSAVFLYEVWLGERAESFINRFAVVPSEVFGTFFRGEFSLPVSLTVLSSMFLHGGWMHLLGNMLYLYIFGDNVEDRLGHKGFLAFYLLSGIGAVCAEVIALPHSTTPLIGASGAIAGVLGAYFLLFPRARVLTLIPLFIFFPIVEISAFFFLGFWFVLQFVQGAASSGAGAMGGVAWWAHTGGFLVGAILLPVFLFLSPRSHAVARSRF